MNAWERIGRPLTAVAAGSCFYYFLAIPLISEYAYAGTLAAVALAAGLALAIPRPQRLGTVALVLAFLLTLAAVDNLHGQPAALRLGGIALLLIAYPVLARLAAQVPPLTTAGAVAAAALLAQLLLPSLYPVLTGFVPLWVSPPLTHQTKIPFFTPVAADLDGDGRAEIAAVTTAGDAGKAPLRAVAFRGGAALDAAVLLEDRFAYQVFRWDGNRFTPVPSDALSAEAKRRLTALVRDEHAGAPVLAASWSSEPGGLPGFSFRPVADPFQAVAETAPGRLPFALLGLTLREVAVANETWSNMQTQAGHPGTDPELKPLPSNREVAWITAEGDADGDGRPERFINLPDRGAFIAGPATLEPVWRAPNDSLRFAGLGRIGREDAPEILAQDKGAFGFDPRRYLGGYRLSGERLERLWKVFVPGIINPTLADVNGDGSNEIVAALWDLQRVVVLQRHPWPVTQGVWVLTLAILLWPACRRLCRGSGAPGTSAARVAFLAAAGSAAVIVFLAGRVPSPALSLTSGTPPVPLDAGATPDPEAPKALAEAVRRMQAIGRYSFQAETLTYAGQRRIPTGIGGTVAEDRMSAHGAIWGDSYYAYREGDQLHLGLKTWHRQTVAANPRAPLGTTLTWLPELVRNPRRLPGTELVQRTRCRVYVGDADAAAVRRLIPAAVAPPPAFWDAERVPGAFQIKVWVGEQDGIVHQVQTFFDIPLPEATGLRQKTLLWFGSFNDPKLEMKAPETLRTGQPR